MNSAADIDRNRSTPRYSYYAFAVLFLVNIMNNLDRAILSILAPDIKRSLDLSDSELGFLLGTAFAVFYTVVGIAIGRIADQTSRRRLLALGLAIWSCMTVFGGLARNFAMLGAARIGVGVGEATAQPCGLSLLADYFPPHRRSLVTSCYVVGAFVGSMAAMIIGGLFMQFWPDWCGLLPFASACSVESWKAALLSTGVAGLPLTLLVVTLRRPPSPHRAPPVPLARLIAYELGASLPPFSAIRVYRLGSSTALARNLAVIAALVVAAGLLIAATGDAAQWSAAALGVYAIVTWATNMKFRDRPFHEMTFGSATFMLLAIGAGLVASSGAAAHAWAASYAIRALGMAPAQAGASLGIGYSMASVVGVVLGGWLTDLWRRRDQCAAIWMAMISVIGAIPGLLVMVTAKDSAVFVGGFALFGVSASMSGGATLALALELVMPRMRSATISLFSLTITLLGAGLGPYWVGKISSITGSLGTGLFSMVALTPIAVIVLFVAARRLRQETDADRFGRAAAVGEAVPDGMRPHLA